jgi:hypothetical protein
LQVILIAALAGAVGGLVYELLLERAGDSGTIEVPGRRGKRYQDLGFFASLIVGAVAAVAFLFFYDGREIVRVEVPVAQDAQGKTSPQPLPSAAGRATTSDREYEVVKLIAVSLIVGSAGGSFMSAMRNKVLAMVNGDRVKTLQGLTDQLAHDAGATLTEGGPGAERLLGRLQALRDTAGVMSAGGVADD